MTPLARLAQAHGIALRYHDIWGTEHEASAGTLRALLEAMGVDAGSDARVDATLEALEQAAWKARTLPLVVVREHVRPWSLRVHVPADVDAGALRMRIVREDGHAGEHAVSARIVDKSTIDGAVWQALDVAVAIELPPGYHRVALVDGDVELATTTLAVTPGGCHRPPALRGGGRAWGLAIQLYGLRSQRNWGIGDFTDLANAVAGWGAQGAAVVGVNPLHALFPHNPAHVSPYSPSSRLFANVLYLDVEAVEGFADCAAARECVADPAFQARLVRLREADLVDHPGVAAAKREVLEVVFADFRRAPRSARAQFEAFVRDGGSALQRHARFEALQEHFHAADPSVWGWPAWPQAYRDPASGEVERFADEHRERVEFYLWLQWQADLQRASLATTAERAGLAIGLYADLAVSIDRGGAEAWANQQLYALSASVGAPPDAFNPGGQDWGLPPIVPSRLQAAAYAPFIATLRANMRHAGALRIDHVMGLMRLFWVPPKCKPGDGAYVGYPFDDLVGLLALESHRHRCLVIGEDLGTVPDEVRAKLADADVLSYRVLVFERDDVGAFKPPSTYPEAALATASTHDLPTLAGWWRGEDIDTRAQHGLVDAQDRERMHAERVGDRARLLQALAQAGALPAGASLDAAAWPEMSAPLAEAIAAFLAATPCVLEIVQLEDALLVADQANLPGTTNEHPNWRRKLPLTVDETLRDERVQKLASTLRALRPA